MMFWYGDGMNGWGWFAMSAGMVLFWGLLITVAVMLFRTLDHSSQRPPRSRPAPSAEQILGERLARGEIEEDEYRRRLTALRSAEP
ncbi:SHOCT domain-containing protein [Streptomyces sp. NPDC047972]|uniref:SHOCT domain-containing protein n=1 Tax=Streptomyces sp. NPDC047972 TaxID=3365493 RepID=UPI003711894F